MNAPQSIATLAAQATPAPLATRMRGLSDRAIAWLFIAPTMLLLLAEQKRIHDFVVADKGTAKEALDGLLADWKKVFKEDGKVK